MNWRNLSLWLQSMSLWLQSSWIKDLPAAIGFAFRVVIFLMLCGAAAGLAEQGVKLIDGYQKRTAEAAQTAAAREAHRNRACHEHAVLLAIVAQKAAQYSSIDNARYFLRDEWRKLETLHRDCNSGQR